jgi:hypothetical protein
MSAPKSAAFLGGNQSGERLPIRRRGPAPRGVYRQLVDQPLTQHRRFMSLKEASRQAYDVLLVGDIHVVTRDRSATVGGTPQGEGNS